MAKQKTGASPKTKAAKKSVIEPTPSTSSGARSASAGPSGRTVPKGRKRSLPRSQKEKEQVDDSTEERRRRVEGTESDSNDTFNPEQEDEDEEKARKKKGGKREENKRKKEEASARMQHNLNTLRKLSLDHEEVVETLKDAVNKEVANGMPENPTPMVPTTIRVEGYLDAERKVPTREGETWKKYNRRPNGGIYRDGQWIPVYLCKGGLRSFCDNGFLWLFLFFADSKTKREGWYYKEQSKEDIKEDRGKIPDRRTLNDQDMADLLCLEEYMAYTEDGRVSLKVKIRRKCLFPDLY